MRHSYDQKPMKTPLVLMARSAMGYQQKLQIQSNEMTRRLNNVMQGMISQEEINEIIEQYITELNSSGYSRREAQEIVMSGIKAWKARGMKRKRRNEPYCRLA